MALLSRKINVTFSLAQGSFSESGTNSVTLPGLRISAKILKAGGPSMGKAQLLIYGMTLSLMNKLSTLGMVIQLVPRNTVLITAGDDVSGMGTVFIGTITSAYADFQAAPEVPFNVEAHTGIIEAVTPVDPLSYSGSTDVATVMSSLATQAGLAFENNGVSTQLSNPYFPGSVWSQMQAAAKAANIGAVIDNGKLAIWPNGGTRGGQVPLVAPPPDGQMIGYPAYTSYGLMVKTQFNPSIGFMGKIRIKSSLDPANGEWAVYGLAHDLDSLVPKGNWASTLQCFNPKFPRPVT